MFEPMDPRLLPGLPHCVGNVRSAASLDTRYFALPANLVLLGVSPGRELRLFCAFDVYKAKSP